MMIGMRVAPVLVAAMQGCYRRKPARAARLPQNRSMQPTTFSAPADRNKQPILEMLRRVLPASGTALEIASGSGQHVTWFAAAMPGWQWQPTDADAAALPAITEWIEHTGVANVRPPLRL